MQSIPRTNSFTCLTNLQVLRLPAGIYNCTGAAYCSAESICQILEQLEVLCTAYATAAGYQNFCIHDIFNIGYSLYNLKNLNILVIGNKTGVELLDHCLCANNTFCLLHNADER